MNFDHDNSQGSIKPCPVCKKPITLRKTSAVVDGGYRKWFYFLYCSQCGYGPNNAFDTVFQAVKHWNDATLTVLPSLELLAKKPANLFMPRLFN